MLHVTPMQSGTTATAYYTAPETQVDINPEKRGQWAGLAAERLGLSGEVKRSDFLALSMNKDPRTGIRLTPRNRKNRNSGYDLCFDVPKSLSLYLAETGDKRVESIILEAFKETMSEIEKSMQTRVRKNGVKDDRRDTGNMVYAWYTHHLSRPVNGQVDPNHHLHAFVFNATYDLVEDRWKAGQIYNIVTASALYRDRFTDRIANKLMDAGFRIRKTDHAFELSNVSRELIERFSKRTMKAAEAVRQKYGELKTKVRMFLATRENKQDIKPDIKSQMASQMEPWERRSLSEIYEQEQAEEEEYNSIDEFHEREVEQEAVSERDRVR